MLKKAIICGREVEYDDTEFELVDRELVNTDMVWEEDQADTEYCLHYIGGGKNVRNPKGNICTAFMFKEYPHEYLDLSNFDTSEVEYAYGMFKGAKFKTVNLSSLDLSNVKNISFMFELCENLEYVDMHTVRMNPNTVGFYVFTNCLKLEWVDFSSLSCPFYCLEEGFVNLCPNLKWIDLSSVDCSEFGKSYLSDYANRLRDYEKDFPDKCFTDTDICEYLRDGFGIVVVKEEYLAYWKANYYDYADRFYSKEEFEVIMPKDFNGVSIRDISKLDALRLDVQEFAQKLVSYKDGISKRSVGEIADILYRRYSNNLVNSVLIDMLCDEKIIDDSNK